MKFTSQGSNVQQQDSSVDTSQGAARAISSFIDPSLSWKDMAWFKSITKMPLIVNLAFFFSDPHFDRAEGGYNRDHSLKVSRLGKMQS